MKIRNLLAAVLVVLLLLMPTVARWYTEWLWFGEVGYRSVFWVPILAGPILGLAAGLSVFILLYVNARPCCGSARSPG
jgi:uncharacterized membrane protein (UPF0182 family)